MRKFSLVKKYILTIVNYRLVNLFNSFNFIQLPKIVKIVINVRINLKLINKVKDIISGLFLISLQKPLIIYSRISISNFSLKKRTVVGIKVVLINFLMYEFLGKLLNLYLPRLKTFNGFLKSSFDQFGNYNFGIINIELLSDLFPNLKVNLSFGFDINIIILSNSIRNSYLLLKKIGFTFL